MTSWSLGASGPTGTAYLHQGLVLQSRANKGPVQLPMQGHRAPLRVLCGHWTICRGLVTVKQGLGQVPAYTEQLETR